MTLLLVFYELDMSWLPLFWLDISRIVFGYQGGADSLLQGGYRCVEDNYGNNFFWIIVLQLSQNNLDYYDNVLCLLGFSSVINALCMGLMESVYACMSN